MDFVDADASDGLLGLHRFAYRDEGKTIKLTGLGVGSDDTCSLVSMTAAE